VKWIPAAAILTKIAIYGKIQVNRQTIQTLALSLGKIRIQDEKERTGKHGISSGGLDGR